MSKSLKSLLILLTVLLGNASLSPSSENPHPPERADLVIEGLDYYPQSPPALSQISFRVVIHNLGPGTARGEIGKIFLSPGAYNASVWVKPLILPRALPKGNTFVFQRQIPIKLEPADYRLGIELAPMEGSMFDATDESKHQELALSVKGYSPSRLAIQNFKIQPEHPLEGDKIQVLVTVKNTGGATVPQGKEWVHLSLFDQKDQQILDNHNFELDQNLPTRKKVIFKPYELPVEAKAGKDYRLQLQIEPLPGEKIDLTAFDKNRFIDFSVKPLPPLQVGIDSFTMAPETLAEGQQAFWKLRLTNRGERALPPGSWGAVRLADEKIGVFMDKQEIRTDLELSPSRTVELQGALPSNLSAGPYRLSIQLSDDGGRVLDGLTEKERDLRFTVLSAGKPELVLDEFTYSPEHPKEGEKIKIRLKVRNSGEASFQAGPIAEISLVDAWGKWILWSQKLSLPNDLGPHNTYKFPDFEVEKTLPPDDYRLLLQLLDSERKVPPLLSEKRKEYFFTVGSLRPPDLVIKNFGITPSRITTSSEVIRQIGIKNIGGRPFPPGVCAEMRVIDNVENKILWTEELRTPRPLLPGQSFAFPEKKLPLTLLPGSYRVTLGIIPEIKERSGQEAAQRKKRYEIHLLVQPEKEGDLAIQKFTILPTIPALKDRIIRQVTVTNIGESPVPAGSWLQLECREEGVERPFWQETLGLDEPLPGRKSFHFTDATIPVVLNEGSYRLSLQVLPKAGVPLNTVHGAKRQEITFEIKPEEIQPIGASDLVLENFEIVPEHPIPDAKVSFYAKVKNNGPGPLRKGDELKVHLMEKNSKEVLWTGTFLPDPLLQGESYQFRNKKIDRDLKPGRYIIAAQVFSWENGGAFSEGKYKEEEISVRDDS